MADPSRGSFSLSSVSEGRSALPLCLERVKLQPRPRTPSSESSVSQSFSTPQRYDPQSNYRNDQLQRPRAKLPLPTPTLVHVRSVKVPTVQEFQQWEPRQELPLKRSNTYSDAAALIGAEMSEEGTENKEEDYDNMSITRSSSSSAANNKRRKASISSFFTRPVAHASSSQPSVRAGQKEISIHTSTPETALITARQTRSKIPRESSDVQPSEKHANDETVYDRGDRQMENNTDVVSNDFAYQPTVGSDSEFIADNSSGSDSSDTSSAPAMTTEDVSEFDEEQGSSRDIARAADFLLGLFTFDDFGCSSQEHVNVQESRCSNTVNERCTGLDTTYIHKGPMMVPTGGLTTIGLRSSTFPESTEMNRNRFLRADRLQRLFEGTATAEYPPQKICLHSDHQTRVMPGIEYDVDSFLVFMQSFDGFRDTADVRTTFIKECRFNISSDLHISIPVMDHDQRGRTFQRLVQIRHVPHLYIGTVSTFPSSTVFVVFPRLYTNNGEKMASSWLTDDLSRKFFNTWLTVCRRHASPFLRQALPPDAECAEGRARVKNTEHRSAIRGNPLKEIRHFPIPVDTLRTAWAEACSTFEKTPGLGVFRDASLFVNVKNTKLQDPAPTLLGALRLFRDKMDTVFVRAQVKYYADPGAKILPLPQAPAVRQTDRAPSQDTLLSDDVGQEEIRPGPYTYLWRSCCLERLYSRIRTTFGGSAGKKQTYNSGLLRDATNLSLEPPSKSWIRKAGVLYFQAYNSVKEIEDAQQVYPFDRPRLQNLALAPDVVGPLTLSVDRASLVQSYCASKDRIRREYTAWRSTDIGTRFECRASDEVIDEMIERLETAEDNSETIPRLGSITPVFVWCVPTRQWCEFMYGNHDKITALLEMIVLSGPRTGITLASSQLLYALLTYLRAFSNSNPARKSLLWAKEVSRTGQLSLGFDLKNSIRVYGFGWLAPHVDWQGLRLRSHAVGNLIGCGDTVGSGYREPMQRVQDQRAILDLLHRYIVQSQRLSPRVLVAMKTMAHYVLRQYRRDVLAFLNQKRELHAAYEATAEHDKVVFSHSGLVDVLVQRPHYVSARKLACGSKDTGELFELLMGTDPHPRPRTNFDGAQRREWRQLIHRIRDLFLPIPDLRDMWHRRLRTEFERYMFVLPYPDPGGSFLETQRKTGQRSFYAAGYIEGRWCCVSGSPRLDSPPEYPKTLWMSFEDLEEYLNRHSDRE